MTRDEAIRRIRKALRRRSGKPWSVTGGRGTAYGWITISAPPARRTDRLDSEEPAEDPERRWHMTLADRRELGKLLGNGPCHCQGVNIPDSAEYRERMCELAETGRSETLAEPYWD